MLKFKLFTVYVFLETLFCGCAEDKKQEGFQVRRTNYKIEQIGKMAKEEVAESSGLELSADGNYWTHADGGNPPVLYKVNEAGKRLQTLNIPDTDNLDWEDLAKDDAGNIYIGDMGNNGNLRRNLRIFRINENNVSLVDTIRFSYEDQRDFPPAKANRNFDCEAFFYSRGSLYLFSKNRGRNAKVNMYRIPAQPGTYVAKLIDSVHVSTMITAADISPDGSLMALLGYGKIYLFALNSENKFFNGKKYCRPFGKTGQAEALVFTNNHDFVFSNEGGKIFKAVKRKE